MKNSAVQKNTALYFYYKMSLSSNGSPHSGQNLGIFEGSDGCQPHLSHLYIFAVGFCFPQFAQNLPLFSVPHEHLHVPESAGFGFPHSAQNLPVFSAPHEHLHVPDGAGLDLPQFAQNLPVFSVPHEHLHVFALLCCCAPIWKRLCALKPPACCAMFIP